MADTQPNPQAVTQNPDLDPSGVVAAQEAILGLLDSQEQPDQEAVSYTHLTLPTILLV